MSRTIGIDLGTTFSAVGYVSEGIPRMLAFNGERIMPSVIGLTPDENLLVGTPAQNQYVLYPERTIKSVKRKMGEDVRVPLGERSYTPQEASGIILRELKRRAEEVLGEPIDRAVITVPAYFSDSARHATYEAGQIAGFSVERIIHEPTAAALAYGMDQIEEHQFIAVYDLGGGTFDVSIVEMDTGVIEVRASHGNTQLGGDDFDQRLADYLAERFIQEHDVDPRKDPRAAAKLLRVAERTKIALSSQPFTQVQEEYFITHEGKPLHLNIEISRLEFENLIKELVQGTIESFDAALRDAEIEVDQLSRILFVGGSTRIPLVWQMVNDHTDIEPDMTVNPDEAVAIGAAVQAAIVDGDPIDAILVDVTPHSLGIQVVEWQFGRLVPDCYSVIIHRNTTIPTSRSEVYSAVYPDQDAIEIKVYQGEHPVASRNTLLGEFVFEELQPEVAGMPPRVTVQFDFDVNGILHVSAIDRGSGRQATKTVRATRATLSPADIDRTRAEIEALEQSSQNGYRKDIPAQEIVVETDMQISGLLARAREAAAHSNGNTAELTAAIAALEQAIRDGDDDAIEERAEELLDVLFDMEDEGNEFDDDLFDDDDDDEI